MLFACLLAGLVLARSGRLPDNAHASLNAVIVHISLPALTLHYLHGFSFDAGHLAPVAMPWLLFALGALVFWGIGRALRLSRPTVGALTLVGGFGNTSFVGLPMIEALYGESGLPLGLLIDQLGSYLALSTVGITVAAFYAVAQPGTHPGAALSFASVARKVFTFPPFVAMVLALALVPVKFPEPVDLALARVGDTLAPLALLSVGLQLRFGALRRRCADVSVGLA